MPAAVIAAVKFGFTSGSEYALTTSMNRPVEGCPSVPPGIDVGKRAARAGSAFASMLGTAMLPIGRFDGSRFDGITIDGMASDGIATEGSAGRPVAGVPPPQAAMARAATTKTPDTMGSLRINGPQYGCTAVRAGLCHATAEPAAGDRLARSYRLVPKWRNGRRGGLKIRGPQGRPSSNLGFGTTTSC